jgi:hypothetical protein
MGEFKKRAGEFHCFLLAIRLYELPSFQQAHFPSVVGFTEQCFVLTEVHILAESIRKEAAALTPPQRECLYNCFVLLFR